MEKISIKHQPDSNPNITDNTSAGGIGPEKGNHKDDADLTTVTWNKDTNAERSDCVSSNNSREMSGVSKRLQPGINQPSGMA